METETKLTKAELLALPAGRELDRMVAVLVYNARPCGNDKERNQFLIMGDFKGNVVKPLRGNFRTAMWNVGVDNAWNDIPYYSTEIADTWKLIEDHPFVFGLQTNDVNEAGITEWMITDGNEQVLGKTAQEAICRMIVLSKIIIE